MGAWRSKRLATGPFLPSMGQDDCPLEKPVGGRFPGFAAGELDEAAGFSIGGQMCLAGVFMF